MRHDCTTLTQKMTSLQSPITVGDRVSIRENATSIRTGRVTDIIRRVDQTTVKERVMLCKFLIDRSALSRGVKKTQS